MSAKRRHLAVFGIALGAMLTVAAVGCGSPESSDGPPRRESLRVETPTEGPAGQPRWARDGDDVLLSWVETDGEAAALRFARWDGTRWSPPRTAARGTNWFVNWADTPGVVPTDSRLLAFYLERTAGGPYDYAIRLIQSSDEGRSWTEPVTPHAHVDAEYGFVSTAPTSQGTRLLWLDGRATASADDATGSGHAHHHGPGAMGLRTAVLTPDGALLEETLLDDRVCDCCPTALVAVPDGFVAAYRDRSPTEVRDIATVRHDGIAWSTPTVPHPDGWRIDGCPVNGPALAAHGDTVVLAWFSGVEGGRVRLARSTDAGRSFPDEWTLDADEPVGRVDVAMDAEAVWVSWIARGATPRLVIARLAADGSMRHFDGPAVDMARSTGMPRLALHQGTPVLAWVEEGRLAVQVGVTPPAEASDR